MKQSNSVHNAASPANKSQFRSYFAMMLLIATILGRYEVVSGLDLNPLKNIKRDNSGSSKGQDGKLSQIAMEDAATGTVTALVDPVIEKREEPTSCNEIMAKAVVIASEEKEAAIAARDAALVEAASAKAKVEELSTKIDAAVAEARNATIEYEAMKLLTDRLVQEARREAALKIETIQKQTSEQLEIIQKKVQDEKHELQNQCKEMVEKAEANAKDQKEKDQSEMIAIKKQWEQQVMQLKDELQDMEKDWQDKLRKVLQDSEQQVNEVRKESKEAIESAYNHAEITVNEALERASKIEKEAKINLEEAEKKTTALLQDMQNRADERIVKIREECSSELEEKDLSHKKLLEQNKKKYSDLALVTSKKEEELQSVIESQNILILSLQRSQEQLESDVSELKDDLKYWIDLHDSQGFVNTTLVAVESKRALDQSVNAVKDWITHMKKVIIREGKVIQRKFEKKIRPYREEVERYYHLRLESKINELVLPFYQTHIRPVCSMMQQHVLVPMAMKYRILTIEILKNLYNIKDAGFQRMCFVTQRCASYVKRFLMSDGVQQRFIAPQSIMIPLSHIENDAKGFLSAAIKLILLLVLYNCRKAIISLVRYLCFLPLRIVWYLCPLRLIGRRSKCERQTDSNEDRSNNDTSVSLVQGKMRMKKELEEHEKSD